MTYAIAYTLALLVFLVLDVAWLSTMGARLYKPVLASILLDNIRIAPALAFYLMYPAGLVIFGIMPGLKIGSPSTALLYGALFGLFAYGTYELTNYATLRDWTLQITLIDMAYGAIVSGAVAALATMITPAIAGLFGVR